MIKYLILTILIVSSAFGKNSKWQKHYKLVLSDIKSVEALKTRDLSLRVRLFELYGEKLNLLIEKENDYKLGRQYKNTQRNINAVVSRQKVALKKLESIAVKIERQTKDSKILAKINYYRALNYSLVKKYDKVYIYIKFSRLKTKNSI